VSEGAVKKISSLRPQTCQLHGDSNAD